MTKKEVENVVKKEERKLETLAVITLKDDSLVITIKKRKDNDSVGMTKQEIIDNLDFEL